MRADPIVRSHSGDATMTDVPALEFAVEQAGVLEYAAAPTLELQLRVDAGNADVRSLLLNAQIRILAPARSYDDATIARLEELFGHSADWGRNLHALPWLERTLVVPAFTGSTRVPLRIPCGYDFEVAASKYLHAVQDGVIPLELLFSGSIFFTSSEGALQTVRVPWDREARFDMRASIWHELMELYFPNTAWLRVRRDVFDRLNAFRTRQIPPSWDAALEALLRLEQP